MNYNKKTVRDIDVQGKKVLLRCDFNVPQDKTTGVITDDKRIRAALPTIQYLLEKGAAVIACSGARLRQVGQEAGREGQGPRLPDQGEVGEEPGGAVHEARGGAPE